MVINDNRAEEGRTGSARIDIDLMGSYGTGLVRVKISVMPRRWNCQVRDTVRNKYGVLAPCDINSLSSLHYTLHSRNRAHAKLA
jgi:hypothetical protein